MVDPDLENAIAHHAAGRLGEAAAAYEAVVRRASHTAAAWSNYSDVLRRLGNTAEAINACERAVAIDPQFVAGHYNLAMALLDTGQFQCAAEELRRCIELRMRT